MLNNEELLNIHAGALNLGVAALIIAGIVFIIGIVDGYIRPLRCR